MKTVLFFITPLFHNIAVLAYCSIRIIHNSLHNDRFHKPVVKDHSIRVRLKNYQDNIVNVVQLFSPPILT